MRSKRRRGCNVALLSIVNPSVITDSLSQTFGLPAPSKREPFGIVQTPFLQKPPCRGRWLRVQRADGGSKNKLTVLCLLQPLSRLAATAPRPGSLLVCVSTAQKLSPLAGDSSRARPVDDEARGESGGIGSVASYSAARRPYSNQRSWP